MCLIPTLTHEYQIWAENKKMSKQITDKPKWNVKIDTILKTEKDYRSVYSHKITKWILAKTSLITHRNKNGIGWDTYLE